MPSEPSRPLRADAARNSEKILRAARELYAERGSDVPLEEIARRAGVGIATLYRRFPDKAILVRTALEQTFTEEVLPVLERALEDEDPRRGLAAVLESTMRLNARDYNMMAAARDFGSLTAEAGTRFFEALAPLIERGQRTGVIRDDIVLDDLRRIMAMLLSVLWTMDPREDGWQRYVVLVLDALSPEGASPLPPAVPLYKRRPGG
ncbi:helix-turn-helix domain-containing protein [Spirillospora sp. NPDC029432]|uniref:TetR/AcrR family transcriptional regulator n=1 Tax=Spirillospora sp. NPDC029432 TaxID=3154599 RepID=UPI003451A213